MFSGTTYRLVKFMPHLDSEKKKLIAPKLNSLKPKRTETKKNSRSILNQSLMVSSRVKNQEKYPLLRFCTISRDYETTFQTSKIMHGENFPILNRVYGP